MSENGKNDGEDQELDQVEKSTTAQDPPPTIVEWGVRIVSLLILLVLTGYVVWQAVQPYEETTFTFEVKRDEIRFVDGAWAVPVHLVNKGTPSLEDLAVAVELADAAGNVVEKEALTFPLVGEGEGLDAEVWFDRDPSDYQVRLDVTGYRMQ